MSISSNTFGFKQAMRMTQHDLYGYDKVENSNENETETISQKDFHDLVSDEKEASRETSLKARHKHSQSHNHREEEMDMSEENSEPKIDELEKNELKQTTTMMREAIVKSDDKNDSSMIGETDASSQDYPTQPDHKSVLEEASALLGASSMFQPNQISLQTFQNAIAQFTASAIASNMDNETILKNLAILQSALFTIQHQQFLQFQLIQHLQSQLVDGRKPGDEKELTAAEREQQDDEMLSSDGREIEDLTNSQRDEKKFMMTMFKERSSGRSSVDEEQANTLADKEEEKNKKRLKLKLPDFTKPEKETKKSDEAASNFLNDFSLASTIITDHDLTSQSNEPTNSLAMLEKSAQDVLNSASQGILSNNLLDELAFNSDKQSPNGRTDSSLFKHRCRYCGKIFGSDSSLQIHIRSHTGERPFKCNVCGSRFTTKGNLKVHFQRHSDKYPHITMNPNPVPEHLDKYFPPLVPSEALKEMPNAPPSPSPFSAAANTAANVAAASSSIEARNFNPRGFFPDFYLARPPFDLFGNMLENGARSPVDLSQLAGKKPSHSPDFRLSPEVTIHESDSESKTTTIKQEPEEETTLNLSSSKRHKKMEIDHINSTSNHKCDGLDLSEPLNNHHHHTNNNSRLEKDKDEPIQLKMKSIESITKIPSVSPPSSSSSTSGSLYQDTVLDPSFFSAHLPRPDSNDSSWENFIEISSETSKLQELVDNIDNKNIEPNQCLVCKKVLSCRSALQMHYRVHTGERPFRCKICGRSFTTKGNLKTHMSVHRIKPPMRTLHQCPVCHQKFSNIFVLQQHIRLHTGEMNEMQQQAQQQEQMQQQQRAESHDFSPLSSTGESKSSPFGGRSSELQAQKRFHDVSDDEENEDEKRDFKQIDESEELTLEKETKYSRNGNQHSKKSSPHADLVENHVEDLRMNNLQKLSVVSLTNDEHSRSGSPRASLKEPKRLRSSSPPASHRIANVLTPPGAAAAATERLNFPYAPQFLGMPQFSPFLNRAPFLASGLTNASMISSANMSPFGLFGVRGNTTTCNICFKTFACNSALEIHYRSHTKERPYKCSVCDRGFSTKGNMKQHSLTHKIRDMLGGSNSGDGFKSHCESQSSSNNDNNNKQSSNHDVQSEESNSVDFSHDRMSSGGGARNENKSSKMYDIDDDVKMDDSNVKKEESDESEYSPKYASSNGDLEQWSSKFNMPENVVAS